MKKVLLLTGSINQTMQMHQIANELHGFDCWFSQLFSDSRFGNYLLNNTSLFNGTIMSVKARQKTESYLNAHDLKIDYRAQLYNYDLVVFCSDMVIPKRLQQTKTIWVQEGMVDKYTLLSKIIKALKLPAALTGDTSLNGSADICDVYCAASWGYKQYFAKRGTRTNKIVVTGMPNYDNLNQFERNDFPHKGYVMVATTDMRETFRYENRPAFIKQAVKIAEGRPMLFKLHPNENVQRAEREIRKYAPQGTLIFSSGNTNHMIANCCELITQYSTVVYTGIALGKKVHSWFDVNELKKLLPVQNQGQSAKKIAQICSAFLMHEGSKQSFDLHNVLESDLKEQEFENQLLAVNDL